MHKINISLSRIAVDTMQIYIWQQSAGIPSCLISKLNLPHRQLSRGRLSDIINTLTMYMAVLVIASSATNPVTPPRWDTVHATY